MPREASLGVPASTVAPYYVDVRGQRKLTIEGAETTVDGRLVVTADLSAVDGAFSNNVDVEETLTVGSAANPAAALVQLQSNRPTAGLGLGNISAFWASNLVARLLFISGADTVNKDEGYARIDVWSGGVQFNLVSFGSAASPNVIVNSPLADVDLQVKGTVDANLLRTDAGNNRCGVGTATPAEKLDVNGNAYVRGYVTLTPVAPGSVPNNSQYVSNVDGKLYFKDGAGVSNALY